MKIGVTGASGFIGSKQTRIRFQSKKYKIEHSTDIPEPPYILCLTLSFAPGLPKNKGENTDIKEYMNSSKKMVESFGNVKSFEIDTAVTINKHEFAILAWDNKYMTGQVYKRLMANTLINNQVVLFNFANSTEFNREKFIAESMQQLGTVKIN